MTERDTCYVVQECDPDSMSCGTDLYFLSGYVADDLHTQLPGWDLSGRNIFACNADYEENEHDLKTVADIVVKGIDENSKGKVDLLGYSWGGFVAQDIAHRYPDHVNKLVLVNTFSKIHVPEAAAALKLLSETKIDPRVNGDVSYIERSLSYDFTDNGIKAPAFIYNCMFDNIFIGPSPNIVGSTCMNDMCVHHWGRRDTGGNVSKKVKNFLDR